MQTTGLNRINLDQRNVDITYLQYDTVVGSGYIVAEWWSEPEIEY